jgi:hypothetical protein
MAEAGAASRQEWTGKHQGFLDKRSNSRLAVFGERWKRQWWVGGRACVLHDAADDDMIKTFECNAYAACI